MNNRNVKACFLNLYLIANSIFLSGCHDKDLNSINWQLSPDKPQTKTIQNICISWWSTYALQKHTILWLSMPSGVISVIYG